MKKATISTKKLVYTATLTAIAAVLNIFVVVPAQYFAVTFVALPCFFAGVFLGPVYGFTVGLLGDLIGCIIHPLGPYIPLIGIASGLLGFIPGIIFQYVKLNDYIKIGLAYLLCLIICTAGVNTFALWYTYGKVSRTFWAYLILRLPYQAIMTVINASITYIVFVPLKKFVFRPLALTKSSTTKPDKEKSAVTE